MKDPMDPLRIGIIGCGAAAQRYYVPAFKQYPELIDHLCLVDKNIEQAKGLADLFGGGTVFDDHRAIIGQVDGVIIALPHFLHFPVTMDFLNAGIHVLCEKPLAETSEQVQVMVETAAERNIHLCVNNTRRMFPAFQAVKKIIGSGRIGKLQSIQYIEGNSFAWPSATGFYVNPSVTDKGVLLDLGPHVLDTICWWLGGEKPTVTSCQDDSFGGPESVTHITAEVNDCSIDIMLNRLLELENSYTVVGEKGVIKGKIFDWCNCTVETNNGERESIFSETKVKTFPDFVIPVIDNFLQTVQGKADPLVPGHVVTSSIEMIDESYALRTCFDLPWYKKVELPPLPEDGKILVTGATGFIGCRIVELLHLSGRSNVRAAIHQWASAARLGRFPVDIVVMDIMSKDEIKHALEGVGYIIHCAKGAGGATDQGTRNLLELALEKEIKHFVHISTTEVYGNVEGKIDENAPFQYTGNEYNKVKIDAEKICWEFNERGLPITVLRPSIVYGVFSTNWTIHLAEMLRAGKWGVYETYGEGLCNLIYVDDLVHAILKALANKNAIGQSFNVVGPEVITWNEYFRRLNEEMGLPPLPLIAATQAKKRMRVLQPVRIVGRFVKKHYLEPIKKIASSFRCVDTMLRYTESTLKSTPCEDELKLYMKKVEFDGGKASNLLEVKSSINIYQGIRLSCAWLKHHLVI